MQNTPPPIFSSHEQKQEDNPSSNNPVIHIEVDALRFFVWGAFFLCIVLTLNAVYFMTREPEQIPQTETTYPEDFSFLFAEDKAFVQEETKYDYPGVGSMDHFWDNSLFQDEASVRKYWQENKIEEYPLYEDFLKNYEYSVSPPGSSSGVIHNLQEFL